MTFKTEEERDSAILELVNIAGTHVMFENQGGNINLNKGALSRKGVLPRPRVNKHSLAISTPIYRMKEHICNFSTKFHRKISIFSFQFLKNIDPWSQEIVAYNALVNPELKEKVIRWVEFTVE